MGFLDFAKSAGTAIMNKANEMKELRSEYECKSDDELFSIANSSGFFSKSKTEKMVACVVLKNRGYSVEDIKSRA